MNDIYFLSPKNDVQKTDFFQEVKTLRTTWLLRIASAEAIYNYDFNSGNTEDTEALKGICLPKVIPFLSLSSNEYPEITSCLKPSYRFIIFFSEQVSFESI